MRGVQVGVYFFASDWVDGDVHVSLSIFVEDLAVGVILGSIGLGVRGVGGLLLGSLLGIVRGGRLSKLVTRPTFVSLAQLHLVELN